MKHARRHPRQVKIRAINLRPGDILVAHCDQNVDIDGLRAALSSLPAMQGKQVMICSGVEFYRIRGR